jgi:hypothetical protein
MIYTGPTGGDIRSSSQASAIKCSRTQQVVIPGEALQDWWMLNADSTAPTSGSNFYSRDPAGVVDLVNARSWSEFTGTYELYFPAAAARTIEAPGSFSSPYSTVIGDSVFKINGLDYSLATVPLTYAIWGTAADPGSPLIFRWDNGGMLTGLGGRGTYWASVPLPRDGSGYDGTHQWQNPVVAQRSRYRTDGRYYGFEAAAELWVQYTTNGTSWNWGWGRGVAGAWWRAWAKNWSWSKSVATTPFDFVHNPHDLTTAWSEVTLPASGAAFYTPADTLMNGFLGRILVHCFESKAHWQTRTGWTLA